MTDDSIEPTRCGFIALVGVPNAGKSTLLNSLVGAKVSIVTHKAQTTRAMIRGVATKDQAQIVFIDTPGIFAPKRRLDRAMVDAAWTGAGDADFVALIVDAQKGITPELDSLLEGLRDVPHPKVLVLNKIDTVKRESLLLLSQQLNLMASFEQTFMVSALNGDGVGAFFDWCATRIPLGPWHFPEDQLTDLTLALTAAEVTREKLFLRIHEEIPYNATVETEKFTVQQDGSYRIDQVIYVTRPGHKKIVLGEGGQTIKSIGAASRADLMEMFETKVHLFLFVKVREKWSDDPERYREMGLELAEVEVRAASFPDHAEAVAAIDATFVATEMLALDQVDAEFRQQRVRVDPPVRKDFPLGEIGQEGSVALLAISEGRIVAVACADFHAWNNRLAITHFYVDARHRRKGIGAKMMEEVATRGGHLHADHLWVETSNFNVPAVDAYRRWGFALCGLDAALYRGTAARGEVAVFLSRPLRP